MAWQEVVQHGIDSTGLGEGIRKVGDGEKGVLVEDVAVKEPLQEVPRHWGRQLSRGSGGEIQSCWGEQKVSGHPEVRAIVVEVIGAGAKKE